MMMTSLEKEEYPLWVALILCVSVLNGLMAISCAVFVAQTTRSTWADKNVLKTKVQSIQSIEHSRSTPAPTIDPNIHPRESDTADHGNLRICGKRPSRDLDEFDIVLHRQLKHRRIVVLRPADRRPRRSRSFGDSQQQQQRLVEGSTTMSLRRVVSSEDLATLRQRAPVPPRLGATSRVMSRPTQTPMPSALREIRLSRDVLSSAAANISTLLMTRLRVAAKNAIDEVLTSMISFLTYGLLLLLVRQYSAIAVGVSLDVGAFSIEL